MKTLKHHIVKYIRSIDYRNYRRLIMTQRRHPLILPSDTNTPHHPHLNRSHISNVSNVWFHQKDSKAINFNPKELSSTVTSCCADSINYFLHTRSHTHALCKWTWFMWNIELRSRVTKHVVIFQLTRERFVVNFLGKLALDADESCEANSSVRTASDSQIASTRYQKTHLIRSILVSVIPRRSRTSGRSLNSSYGRTHQHSQSQAGAQMKWKRREARREKKLSLQQIPIQSSFVHRSVNISPVKRFWFSVYHMWNFCLWFNLRINQRGLNTRLINERFRRHNFDWFSGVLWSALINCYCWAIEGSKINRNSNGSSEKERKKWSWIRHGTFEIIWGHCKWYWLF